MFSYKSSSCGTKYVEVDPKYSTQTCSTCGAVTGPVGLNGLKVRQWQCSVCGTEHDRDVNSAINVLVAVVGVGTTHEVNYAQA
jgi:transposase